MVHAGSENGGSRCAGVYSRRGVVVLLTSTEAVKAMYVAVEMRLDIGKQNNSARKEIRLTIDKFRGFPRIVCSVAVFDNSRALCVPVHRATEKEEYLYMVRDGETELNRYAAVR